MRINGIDEKDNVIIDLLQKDGRMTYSDIAEEIGLTRTAVKNRVRSLEEKGITAPKALKTLCFQGFLFVFLKGRILTKDALSFMCKKHFKVNLHSKILNKQFDFISKTRYTINKKKEELSHVEL